MALNTHQVITYERNLRLLAGGPHESVLKKTAIPIKLKGRIHHYQSFGPSREAETLGIDYATLVENKDSNKKQVDAGTATTARQQKTPHDEIVRQTTQFKAVKNTMGYWFDEDDELLEDGNPKEAVLKAQASKVHERRDAIFLNALAKASTIRDTDGGTSAVSFADGGGQSWQAGGGANKELTLNALLHGRTLFANKYISSMETRYLLCAPEQCENLLRNNGDRIQSRDYVEGARYLQEGGTPKKVEGFVIIEHPQLATTPHICWMYTEYALGWGEWKGLRSSYQELVDEQSQYVIHTRENVDCQRVDDARIQKLEITTGTLGSIIA